VRIRHRPIVERVACWSTRHRKTAVGAWLAFMAAAFIVGQFAAGNGVQQYDPGQAGRSSRPRAPRWAGDEPVRRQDKVG
jgi:hypothetical protein